MTVGIAAIFNEDGKSGIILVADKMISLSNITIEHSISKIEKVYANEVIKIWGVGSGDLSLITDFFEKLRNQCEIIGNKIKTVKNVAELGSSIYNLIIRQKVNKMFLEPLGIDYSIIQKGRVEEQILDNFVNFTNGIIKDIQSNLEILIAGLDEHGAHIFKFYGQDFSISEKLGFDAIGSGADSAVWTLIHKQYDPKKSLNSAIVLCSWAKFQSEESFGVGENTDLCILKDFEKEKWVSNGFLNDLRSKVKNINDDVVKQTEELVKSLNYDKPNI